MSTMPEGLVEVSALSSSTGTRYPVGLLLALAGLASGCAEEFGRDAPPTTTVVGVVLDGGSPVSGGWIEFIPVEGTRGSLRSAPLDGEGRFSADRVPVGAVGVGFAAVKARRTDPRNFDSLRTTIRRVIPAGPQTSVQIDLFDEYLRAQAERSRAQN